jgi:hypothetical protein
LESGGGGVAASPVVVLMLVVQRACSVFELVRSCFVFNLVQAMVVLFTRFGGRSISCNGGGGGSVFLHVCSLIMVAAGCSVPWFTDLLFVGGGGFGFGSQVIWVDWSWTDLLFVG